MLSATSAVLAPQLAAAEPTDGTLTVVVQRDVNADGVYDGEIDTPQAGIDVTVSDAVGATVSGATDGSGTFVVPATGRLSGGRYFVVAQIPAELSALSPVPETDSFESLSTTVDVTSDDQTVRMGVALRSAAAPDPGSDSTVASDRPLVQRVEAARFAVGDLVFRDRNRSGVQDDDEPGAARVSVQLLDVSGEVVASTVSSASGRFMFDRLRAGTYSIRFAGLPAGFTLTGSGVGGDRARDSDPDDTGATTPFSLEVGAASVRPAVSDDDVTAAYINPTIDAGITALRYAVGSQVWLDANGDGLRQPDEPPATATVSLRTEARDLVATAATDDQGRYQFSDLPAGRYRLQFTGLAAHRGLTTSRAGGDAVVDSDPDPVTGLTPVFRLDQNAPGLVPAASLGVTGADFVDTTVAAGVVGVYSVGDTVWRDLDGDGVLGPGDPGVAGVSVHLLGPTSEVLATRRSDASGGFSFTGLPAGSYRLQFTDLPGGLTFATEAVGNDRTVDSDVSPLGLTPVVTLGEDNPDEATMDAGLVVVGSPGAATTAPTGAAPTETALPDAGGVAPAVTLLGLGSVLGGLVCLWRARRRPRLRATALPGGEQAG